ncbi:uncharacterized protein E5676_scaffold455G005170 [Cucumis melo var. makuwa]|uniref:Uncharacterized protein n=1 Tax=Cucumis melo var. makuwa TaxID=1194695 RepID=A0A5D3E6Q9_CUCMM|nr:uncharacterized protein E6C27_scaffold92G001620 [Cucumis melo var. makuwa]TYK31231.1 uncharacterized protein E5676_scaffold455G005170 [Cucumis melo var. makuwa]
MNSVLGIGRDGCSNHSGETDAEASPATPITSTTSLPENHQTTTSSIPLLSSADTRRSSFHGLQFQQCSNVIAERIPNGGDSDKA